MKISSQIRALTLLLLVASVWFGYSFWETSKNLENRRAVNEVVQSIIKATFELNIITNEYISSRNPRIRMQWDNRHTSLELLFVEAEKLLIFSDDKLSLEKIMANEVQSETLFYQLEEFFEKNQVDLSRQQIRKRTQLISQIQVRIQGMLSEASRLSRRSLDRLVISEERLEYTAASVLFFLWPVFIISFILIDRRVIKPISDLEKSAKKLSSGNYDDRIVVSGKNEVSDLARSYNQLADEIQKKISSLTDKSNRLNQSQQELLSLNENLNEMVKEQTDDLRDSENRQRIILESMHDGVITLDENFIIKNVNPSVEDMFGYAEDEIIDKKLSYLIAYLPGEKNFANDYLEALGRHKEKDGFPVEVSLNNMEIDGVSMYTAIVRDNTERKRADKLKAEFVSTVSHELRTPLTAIRGSLGLINGGVLGEIPEKASVLLETASRNTERLLNLINDLLDIQKIEAGKMEFQCVYIDLMEVVGKSIDDNTGYAEQFNVAIRQGDRINDVKVYVDPHRLSQVMANLLSNAAKFSCKNSEVMVHLSIEDGFAKVSVVDQGEGIPVDFHDKIFSKFSQNDSSDTRQKGGTGLGLAISKKIMESMGGRIDFTTIMGQGSTFNIYVPIKEVVSGD